MSTEQTPSPTPAESSAVDTGGPQLPSYPQDPAPPQPPTPSVAGAAADNPVYTGSTEPGLARMAVVVVPPHLADDVLTRLLDSPDVDTAYVKPTGTPP